MEEEKLIKRKKKALNGSNRRVLAEAYNDLATFYYKNHRYSDALDEYKSEAAVCKELGLRLEWGTCCRMIGEMYMLMAEFDKALKYEERHLAVSKELNNLVEEQRAMATLGRIYLLRGQSSSKEEEANASLKAAEKAFMKSLVLCEKLSGKINKHELMDMRARLLLNIGVVQEYLGHLDKAIDCIQKAISICTSQDLYDVLHQCYITDALIYANKKKDNAKALSCLNKALEVASRLEDKVLKTCETLSAKADILVKMSDYHSARQVLLRAWKLNTPDEEERENIEGNLRVVAAICYTEDQLITADPSDHSTLKRLHEALGDGACRLKHYGGAADHYLKMLEHAELSGESGKMLIPIYVSLYQTYKDMGRYSEALDYYEKEYELIKDEPKEAFTTLYNIAEALFLAKRPYDQVEKACLDARNAAKEWNKRKYEIRTLKCLLKYQEAYGETEKMEHCKNELTCLGYDDFDNLDNSDDEQSSAGGDDDVTRIGDDICLEDLTDLSDNDEETVAEMSREIRKRGRGFTIKKNMKGETQLHQACISGNKPLVQRLLAGGHPVNIRDNAGWTPLHEACIHGRAALLDVLVDAGANVNDRGGSECEGITPIYDAASNGHLEIVETLLNRGAVPSLKTDFGKTPLDALRQWRAGRVLDKEEETLYNNICNRLHSAIEKTNVDVARKSVTPVKCNKVVTPPSTSKCNRDLDLDTPVFKRRNIIEDDSDEDLDLTQKIRVVPAFASDDSNESSDDDKKTKKKDVSSVNEYRSAISALRNRSLNDDFPEVNVGKTKPKPALLGPDEVDDDWLEDDLGGNKNKKRKLSDPLTLAAKKPAYEAIRDTVANINRIEPLVNSNSKANVTKQKTKRNDVVIINENSSDSDINMRCNENISPKTNAAIQSMRNISKELNDSKTRDSRGNMKKRCKSQSTLLKAGFQRKISDHDQSSNSGSENEFTHKQNKTSNRSTPVSLSRKGSNENFNSFRSNDGFNLMQGVNHQVMPAMNVIQPINIVQSGRDGRPKQTAILPPMAVDVQVEDKLLKIALRVDTINKLTIGWLVEEVRNRYYKHTGVRPVLSLLTSSGAILSEDDPLSLVLSSPQLTAAVSGWRASHAEERYAECCDALGIAPSEEIQQAVGRSHTTHRLALGNNTLYPSQIRPLFRALTHQTHITAVLIPDNKLTDDGMKYLAECLCTMKQLTQLDISRNCLTCEGAKILLNLFEKATRPVCQSLEYLDISGNKIGDDGFISILKLGQYVRLKTLKLNDCGITQHAFTEHNKPIINLDSIESIDLSYNDLKQGIMSCIVLSLSPDSVVELGLGAVGAEGAAVGAVCAWLGAARDLRLRRLDLSACQLVDGQFMRVYRSISRARNLQSITLKNNKLTFITLKKLLQRQPPVPQINLEGCQDIFKYSPDSDFQVWLPAVDFGRCIPEINVTPVSKNDEERDSFKLFSKTWLNCFKGRGVIEHCDGGVIRFTAR